MEEKKLLNIDDVEIILKYDQLSKRIRATIAGLVVTLITAIVTWNILDDKIGGIMKGGLIKGAAILFCLAYAAYLIYLLTRPFGKIKKEWRNIDGKLSVNILQEAREKAAMYEIPVKNLGARSFLMIILPAIIIAALGIVTYASGYSQMKEKQDAAYVTYEKLMDAFSVDEIEDVRGMDPSETYYESGYSVYAYIYDDDNSYLYTQIYVYFTNDGSIRSVSLSASMDKHLPMEENLAIYDENAAILIKAAAKSGVIADRMLDNLEMPSNFRDSVLESEPTSEDISINTNRGNRSKGDYYYSYYNFYGIDEDEMDNDYDQPTIYLSVYLSDY